MDTRQKLFDGWKGCSNHNCIVTGPKKGMGTNGSCGCLVGASRTQLHILHSKLASILREEEESSDAM